VTQLLLLYAVNVYHQLNNNDKKQLAINKSLPVLVLMYLYNRTVIPRVAYPITQKQQSAKIWHNEYSTQITWWNRSKSINSCLLVPFYFFWDVGFVGVSSQLSSPQMNLFFTSACFLALSLLSWLITDCHWSQYLQVSVSALWKQILNSLLKILLQHHLFTCALLFSLQLSMYRSYIIQRFKSGFK